MEMPPKKIPLPHSRWWNGRFGFVAFQLIGLLICWFVLRLFLFWKFSPGPEVCPLGDIIKMIVLGFHLDLTSALCVLWPLILWCCIIPDRLFKSRFHRFFFLTCTLFFWFGQIFQLFVEYYFFEEFKSRFNTVAIDYVHYPDEVFVNIKESYPVLPVVVISLFAGLALFWISKKLTAKMWETPASGKSRLIHFCAAAILSAALLATAGFQESKFSKERIVNEIANNGNVSLMAALVTANLDYGAYYLTMPLGEAFDKSRRLLTEPNGDFPKSDSLLKKINGDITRPRHNVVLFLEESLGSEFWGSLGRKGATLTPYLDQLSTEGLFFENLYATGNRTVRGFEGILSSFPPLPGDSIVRRDHSENVETIARVLKRDGYDTEFLYGGRGFFDNMRAFAMANGYNRFIEQKDFPHPTFTTAWGVCNEDLYNKTLTELRDLNTKGKPFLATVLSVSNHKPYTYPPGRIPEDPNRKTRENAVKYTDWALGQFFASAKKEAFWTNTIFIVVADHGARVYGSQSIPIHSYEIPLLILGPAAVKQPMRDAQLGCQLDVTPTILGLLGRPYDSLFFGRDLLHTPTTNGFVLINHNRDIGMFKDNRLVVLNLNKKVEFFQGNPKKEEMTRNDHPDDKDRELQADCMALFEMADDLYMNRKYRLDEK